MPEQPIVKRYSTAFKRKVVIEIEQGKYSIEQARRRYDIGGGSTIQKWIRAFGKNHLLAKVVRIQMNNEPDPVKQLEAEKQALESALAQAHLKILCLESTIEVAEEELGLELKKNSVSEALTGRANASTRTQR